MINIKEVEDCLHYEQSIVQKGKKYTDHVNFLLNELRNEGRRHAKCEEDMLVYANTGNASKVLALETFEKIASVVLEEYPEIFGIEFKEHYEKCLAKEDKDYVLLGKIMNLLADHYNRPSAC
jgi:hypothetical protein